MSNSIIRFISLPDLCLGFEFILKYQHGPISQGTLAFNILTATPLLGFDSQGNHVPDDNKYMFVDGDGHQVEYSDDAVILASGSIFPAIRPEYHAEDGIDFIISFHNSAAMFRREFKAFSELVSSDFFTKIYKEIKTTNNNGN